MITITKQNDGVLFTFENSDKYLYGNGSILVPFNTLSIVADESDMITLKKAASNDVFISARYDTDLGYRSKDDAIDDLKGMLFAETGGGSGSGVTPSEVQTMIDSSISGKADASALTSHADNVNVHFSGTQKSNYDGLEAQYYVDDNWDVMPMSVFNDFTNDYSAAMGQFDQRISANTSAIATKADTSAVTAVANDVQTVSGQVQTKVATSDFNAYSAATATAIGNKYDKVSGLTIDANNEGDVPFPFISIENVEGSNSNYTYINDAGIDSTVENNTDESHYSSYMGQGSLGNSATDYPDDNVTSDRNFNITTDGFEQTVSENYDDGESQYTRYSSENVFNYSNGLTLSQQLYDPENDETTNSSLSIINNIDGDGTFIHLSDSDGQLELNTSYFDWTDGTDGGAAKQLNWGDIASTNDILDALFPIEETLSGKADTSAVTQVNNVLTAHTANTTVHVSQAEKDIWNAKVDTSAITTAITSGSTDSEIPTAKAVYDATQSGGGGATYSAGTNISIDTANTINCTLPITVLTGSGSKNISVYASTNRFNTGVESKNGIAIGQANTATTGNYVVMLGQYNKASGDYTFVQGERNEAMKDWSAAFGRYSKTNNYYEFATGVYNNSVTGSTASGQTLFSVGNGTGTSARHNAFEIRQNGDIYVNDGTNDVRLQDTILALGGLKFVQCSQSEYDSMVSGGTVDSSTIYFITNVVS